MDDRYMQIFVGREKDLDLLSMRFENRILNKDNPKVYSYLNAPGIGKTTLLRKFGERIEQEGKGIHLYFSCSLNYQNISDLAQSLILILKNAIIEKNTLINHYIQNHSFPDILKNDLELLSDSILKSIKQEKFYFSTVLTLYTRLMSIIPIFFSTDEIQQLQKITLEDGKTILRSYAQFLADLLPNKILLAISGTQYTILSQIGYGIGSPLNGKVMPVVISPLKHGHIKEYMRQFQEIYPNAEKLLELESYLLNFSGGHPRTIEMILTTYFTIDNYQNFSEKLTNNVWYLLSHSILDQYKIQKIRDMQSDKYFSEIKNWMLKGLSNNLKFEAINKMGAMNLIFDLLTLGVIVQNGSSNYYITSYFHGLAFLETLTGEYEKFLHQVMNNKYFRLMVGGSAGLGYTFEYILFFSLFIKQIKSPYDTTKLSRIEVLTKRKIPHELKMNTLYHLPNVKNIDGIFRTEEATIAVQITTQKSALQSKLQSFEEEIRRHAGYNGWFISLYELNMQSSVIITSGNKLTEILGEGIYNRILELKKHQ